MDRKTQQGQVLVELILSIMVILSLFLWAHVKLQSGHKQLKVHRHPHQVRGNHVQ